MPTKTGTFESALPATEISVVLLDMAEKCWPRKSSFNHDAIVLHDRIGIRGTEIAAHRRGFDFQEQPPFMIVTINDAAGGGSMIESKEGEYLVGENFDLTSDVRRWIAGDLTCRPVADD